MEERIAELEEHVDFHERIIDGQTEELRLGQIPKGNPGP
jgi:hypothetical protein